MSRTIKTTRNFWTRNCKKKNHLIFVILFYIKLNIYYYMSWNQLKHVIGYRKIWMIYVYQILVLATNVQRSASKTQTKWTSNSNIEIHDRWLSRFCTGTSIHRSWFNYGPIRPLLVKSIIAQSVAPLVFTNLSGCGHCKFILLIYTNQKRESDNENENANNISLRVRFADYPKWKTGNGRIRFPYIPPYLLEFFNPKW